MEKLHDIALLLPSLLARTDCITNESRVSFEPAYIASLLFDYLVVREALQEWLNRFAKSEAELLYWFSEGMDNSSQPPTDYDPICIPVFPDSTFSIRFKNGARAGILVHYWSFQLELLMGVLDLCQRTISIVTADEAAMYAQEAHEIAQLILGSIPYLSSCLEGRMVARAPLETVTRYCERIQKEENLQDSSSCVTTLFPSAIPVDLAS
jgi:hypothetical protein